MVLRRLGCHRGNTLLAQSKSHRIAYSKAPESSQPSANNLDYDWQNSEDRLRCWCWKRQADRVKTDHLSRVVTLERLFLPKKSRWICRGRDSTERRRKPRKRPASIQA